ncbi:hypothetical protein L1887_39429 [Cichorium endivia]|nr:hypothetical protein L1887_39429 [Cichorium endivia]
MSEKKPYTSPLRFFSSPPLLPRFSSPPCALAVCTRRFSSSRRVHCRRCCSPTSGSLQPSPVSPSPPLNSSGFLHSPD